MHTITNAIVNKFFQRMKNIFILFIPVLLWSLSSCNSDDDPLPGTGVDFYQSIKVSHFSLAENDEVMDNLDEVFFTVDLVGRRIFNADSLPVGSKINALLANVTVPYASRLEVLTPADTVEYAETDSIDFSDWVKLRVTALNGTTTGEYDIKVNVHKIVPDSMQWSRLETSRFPVDSLRAQKSVIREGNLYSFIHTTGSEYVLYTPASTPVSRSVSFPFTPVLQSLQVMNDEFYMLGDNGRLYVSADGETWRATGTEGWVSLIGSYNDYLLVGLRNNSQGQLVHASYDGSAVSDSHFPVADDFPVTGYSNIIQVENGTPLATQMSFFGGRRDDMLRNAVWSYTPQSGWVKMTDTGFNTVSPREGALFFAYNTTLDQAYKVWFIIGGKDVRLLKDVYTSSTSGIDWAPAGTLLSLPQEVGPRAYASVFVLTESPFGGGGSGSMDWKTVLLPQANSAQWKNLLKRTESREVPFVYVLGGEKSPDSAYNQIWRAVINQLTFDPIP